MNARGLLLFVGGLVAAPQARSGEAAKADLDRLQGTWQLVSATQDGKALPAETVKRTTIVFRGDTFRFPGAAEQATSKDGTITVDPAKTPKEMDARSPQGEVMRGIYELDGDRYRVCFAPAGQARPTAFRSDAGSGRILQSWVRAKAR